APAKAIAGEPVGAEGGHREGQQHGGAGHREAVAEEREEARVGEEAGEVLEGGMERHEARGREDLARRLERGREHPEEREGGSHQQHRARAVEAERAPHENTSSLRNILKHTAVATISIANMMTASAAPMPACR